MVQYGLLLNLNRCVGCYACEVGCKEWHNIKGNKKWITVKTLGPKVVNGKLRMDFFLEIAGDCNFCESRIREGLDPFCVEICPTEAIKLCDVKEILGLLNGGPRYQICKLAAF